MNFVVVKLYSSQEDNRRMAVNLDHVQAVIENRFRSPNTCTLLINGDPYELDMTIDKFTDFIPPETTRKDE